jgi:5-methylcytosine-specific restriction protein A
LSLQLTASVNSPYGEGGLDSRFKVPLQLRKELLSKRLVGNNIINDIQEAEESLKALEETERESIIQSRIGQGLFRKRLIEYWGGCAVTECKFPALLRASHIKPWRLANNAERLDVFNGLLLSPNIDAAFDAGYISFEPSGRILMSDVFKGNPAYELRISPKARLNQKLLSEKHEEYLEFHRTNVFING